ncbi:MAG: alpha/beta fold hydrolase [Acidimicrobiales bacterium]
MSDIKQSTVRVNGIRFSYLEAGEGPLVLLLHGFPDNARTWLHQVDALAGAGYHAVAPFMRGYAPTEIPADGRYDAGALAGDIVGLADALGDGPVFVVGHDWGAIAATAAMALVPEHVRAAVIMAATHPARLRAVLKDPRQIQHVFHFWFFQAAGLAERALQHDDFALVDHLWRFWSPGLNDREHIAQVKRESLDMPGAPEAVLGYYRALLTLGSEAPEQVFGSYPVPTLAIWGGDDLPGKLAEGEEAFFSAGYRREIVPDAGHFVHREAPSQVSRLIVDWLASYTADSLAPV